MTLAFSMNLCSVAGSGAQQIPDTTQAALMIVQNTRPQHTKFLFSTKGSGAQYISDIMQSAALHKYIHMLGTMYVLMIMMIVTAAMIMMVISKMKTGIYNTLDKKLKVSGFVEFYLHEGVDTWAH
jgi:hypothetical protein